MSTVIHMFAYRTRASRMLSRNAAPMLVGLALGASVGYVIAEHHEITTPVATSVSPYSLPLTTAAPSEADPVIEAVPATF